MFQLCISCDDTPSSSIAVLLFLCLSFPIPFFSFLLAGTTHPSKGIISLFPSSSSSSSSSSENNVQAINRTRDRLAAASFFERTNPSCALNGWIRRNSSFLLLLPHPLPITNGQSDAGPRLLLYPITNGRSIGRGPGLLMHPTPTDFLILTST